MANNYPIILAHGIANFDVLTQQLKKKLGFWLETESTFFGFLETLGIDTERLTFLKSLSLSQNGQDYFKQMVPFLKEQGFKVTATQVAFADSLQMRANQLKNKVLAFLRETNSEKVHIIGHSMGGLDARYMIAKLTDDSGNSMADKIASLTTIGTPHKGTSAATPLLTRGGDDIIEVFDVIGLPLDGFKDLTEEACEKFNQEVLEKEVNNSVVYFTYATYQDKDSVFTPIKVTWQIIHDAMRQNGDVNGRNDGLVDFPSQQWDKALIHPIDQNKKKVIHQNEFPFQADHLNQVGWWDLDELGNTNNWSMNIIKEAIEYEAKVRNIYLQIANTVKEI